MDTNTRATTVEKQAPSALLTLVQHMNDHELGLPRDIVTPTVEDPYFSVGITAHAAAAWTASGFVVDSETSFPVEGNCGSQWERITQSGRLLSLLPVRLMFTRKVSSAPRLTVVTP